MLWLFFFKQKTAYEMRISDWSSDVCSSDLDEMVRCVTERGMIERAPLLGDFDRDPAERRDDIPRPFDGLAGPRGDREPRPRHAADFAFGIAGKGHRRMDRGRHRAGIVERLEDGSPAAPADVEHEGGATCWQRGRHVGYHFRTEERRVGKRLGSTCRSRGVPEHT